MAKRGRPTRNVPATKIHILISVDVAAEVNLLLLDPLRKRMKYGAWSGLVEELLREWIERQRRAAAPAEPDLFEEEAPARRAGGSRS